MNDNVVKKSGRILRGVVVSDSADKTVRVSIVRQIKQKPYQKIVRRQYNVQAHDADNIYKIGDMVTLQEIPRVSKTKSWKVIGRGATGAAQ